MFTWFGTKLSAVLSTYVMGVVTSLMTAIGPIALSAMTIWVLLYGWAVVRNEVPESVPSFLWKVAKIGLVLAFSLETGFYISNVADTATSLATGVASTFVPPSAPSSTASSPYALLDEFNDSAARQVSDIMKEAGITRLDLLLAAALFSLGSVAFLCVAVFIVTLATVLLAFVIAVGPLFILCLAWKPTQRFFDSWLSMLLSTVVVAWFAFFSLGLSSFVGQQMFSAIDSAGGFLGTALNVLAEATRYCVLMLVMAIICFQAPALASALTGGAAIHQGVQMLQNVLMVMGLRAVASGGASAASATAVGGVIRAGVGHHGPGVVRTAAYRLAALRGRS